jgi:hemoglobin
MYMSDESGPPSSSDFERELETIFETLGGMETFQRLADAFYTRVEADPLLRPMFRSDLEVSKERQALFLSERFGGPKGFSKKFGTMDLQEIHRRREIGRDRALSWLGHMEAAMEEVGITGRARHSLHCYFVNEANALGDPLHEIRELPLEELKERLAQDPALIAVKGAWGRTLLDYMAGTWNVEGVKLLLSFGANVNGDAECSPLHDAGNRHVLPKERSSEAGKEVVRLLTQAGADVNARHGVGEQTPLHMAARRGNVNSAEALLDAGADIEARDTKGETPLRRAVNCGHPAVVRLLLERGADPTAPDKQGKTPLQAARKPEIVLLFSTNQK